MLKTHANHPGTMAMKALCLHQLGDHAEEAFALAKASVSVGIKCVPTDCFACRAFCAIAHLYLDHGLVGLSKTYFGV